MRHGFRSKLILVFALITLAGGTARADVISVISQNYRIEGYGRTYLQFSPNETVLYDESSAAPLSREDTRVVMGDPRLEPGGFFRITNRATGGVSSTTAFIQTLSHGDDAGLGIVLYANASSSITFMPLATQLLVTIGVPFTANGLTTIYDETSGALAFSRTYPGDPFSSKLEEYLIPFQLDHIYTMTASTHASFGRWESNLTISTAPVSAVPESGTSLTFIVVGVLGLLFCGRRSPREASI